MNIEPAGLVMSVARALAPEDLAMLELEPVKQTSLKKIRDSHHALARTLASGISAIDASRITGFDQTYISIMKADPAFQELLAFYAEHSEAQAADLRERMTLIALDVSAEIRDRLHDDPASFSHGEMRQLLTNLADRVGYGPSSTVHSVVDITENLSYEEQRKVLEALKEIQDAAPAAGPSRVAIDIEPGEAPSPPGQVSAEPDQTAPVQSLSGNGAAPS